MLPHEIVAAHQAGNFDQVQAFYEQKLKTHPKQALWYSLLGVLHMQKHEPERAQDYFKAALEYEQNAEHWGMLGTVYAALGKIEQAESCFQESLKLKTSPWIYNHLGILFMKNSEFNKAMPYFEMAMTQGDPSFIEPVYNLGLCHMHLQNHLHAQHRFEQILKQQDHPGSAYHLGLIAELGGDWEAALKYHRLVESLLEMHPGSLHGIARCLMKQGDPEAALVYFQKTAAVGENDQELWHNMAFCYHQLSAPALALEAWIKCQLAGGSGWEITYHIGVCHQQLFRYQEAETAFRQVLEAQCDHLDSLLNLIAMAVDRYRVQEALDWIAHARKYHPQREDLQYLDASLNQKDNCQRAPKEYVQQLFDHYAHHYESHLVHMLDYQIPTLVKLLVAEYAPVGGWMCSVDLGCGSGLLGEQLKPHSEFLIGVDLSSEMIQRAAKKGHYHALHVADVTEWHDPKMADTELLVMADLLPYLGDLAWLEKWMIALPKGALIALSIEKNQNSKNFHLHQHARFAHHPDYVRSMLKGCSILEWQDVSLRKHQGQAVYGCWVIARKD